VREGGLQELLLHEVDVESLPKDLPERLDVELEPLAVGQSVRVSELTPPEGVRILNSPDQVVVLIAHKVEEVAPDEAEDSDEELDAADEGAVDEDEV
jgi:large subunit ribosomal protein L25